MKRLLTLSLCACIAVSPGCSLFTLQQRSAAEAAVQEEYTAGNITAAQRDAALEAIRSDEGFDWEGLGVAGLNILLATVGAGAYVRLRRGPPTQRVGLPAELIRPARKTKG